MPPTHRPLRLEAAILSRMRSEVTSRSNWANESSTFRVSRPIEVVVLNCCVTDTNDTLYWSNSSTSFAKSARVLNFGKGRNRLDPPRYYIVPGREVVLRHSPFLGVEPTKCHR